MRIIIDNTDHDEGLGYDPSTGDIETVVEAGTAMMLTANTVVVPRQVVAAANTVFEPRLVVADDAIYVAHDDGWIRKWTLVGEIEEAFDPIPISGPNQEETP